MRKLCQRTQVYVVCELCQRTQVYVVGALCQRTQVYVVGALCQRTQVYIVCALCFDYITSTTSVAHAKGAVNSVSANCVVVIIAHRDVYAFVHIQAQNAGTRATRSARTSEADSSVRALRVGATIVSAGCTFIRIRARFSFADVTNIVATRCTFVSLDCA